ncbi:MAG: RlmE family RNA methyltransferase [Rhodospirillaceae bacterium]|jgi:23S rRNA (uridine2552-2'-O)-methyltransferase|nr:RlmE family RNA methyltransferase [Rhodospirillales bacterium]MBT3905368.1 RlmE family RNA methyltransferase [Rhodospirillaceae bacterium]MBT4702769.1 RlmE family RNA methyltransferase [Rhodospirillaceae bacterium]MBT5033832.1 RlmE family RNA methyltransferase [Rhodospirillaceae bacterium]MBT6220237.1 RlmE family RNA methyltransferase [Rhodospirillaceae bacterium]
MNQKGKSKGGKVRGSDSRGITTRVKSAKGRKTSSTNWLKRQLNDPYVQEAQRLGYRSRAAFKLLELDDRFHFLSRGKRILDLGAAPGGWSQVAVARAKSETSSGCVVSLDISEMDDVPGATVLQGDFMDEGAPALLIEALNGPADVVMSDMAAPSTGHTKTDHVRIMDLCETALAFSYEVLAPKGVFIAKVLQGGTEHKLLAEMKRRFAKVLHAKPPSSRKDSAEMYVVAIGFKGNP